MPMQAHFPAGSRQQSCTAGLFKKLSPVSMRGNSQNGGQTTKSLLTSRNVQGFQYSRQCRFPPPFHDTACFLLSPFRHRCAMSAPLRGHPIGKIKFPALSEAVSSEKTSPGRGKMARPERGTGSAKCQKGSKVTKNNPVCRCSRRDCFYTLCFFLK